LIVRLDKSCSYCFLLGFIFAYTLTLRNIFNPYNEFVRNENITDRRVSIMDKEFLTVRTLASLLDMSEQTAYKLSREGIIPGRIKVGKSVRFNKEVVMNWLQNGGASHDIKD
jgi:excisionase family DNA binding protein